VNPLDSRFCCEARFAFWAPEVEPKRSKTSKKEDVPALWPGVGVAAVHPGGDEVLLVAADEPVMRVRMLERLRRVQPDRSRARYRRTRPGRRSRCARAQGTGRRRPRRAPSRCEPGLRRSARIASARPARPALSRGQPRGETSRPPRQPPDGPTASPAAARRARPRGRGSPAPAARRRSSQLRSARASPGARG
jgi:hypothetical protein